MLGRHYLGFEIVPEYYEFAKERLKKVQTNIYGWIDGKDWSD